MIRLLLVDDQASVRAGLRMLLSTEPDITIVGEADSGEAAVKLVEQLRPDVTLMDIVMPHMDGIAAILTLRERIPECAVVVLTLYDDLLTRERARLAGAAAFLGKQATPQALVAVIREVARPQSSSPPAPPPA